MIAIVDYGVGNLFSLRSSLAAIGAEATVSGEESVLRSADRIILPGVGAFGEAAEKLRAGGLDRLLCRLAEEGKPLLGICLGMQLLFDRSLEFGSHDGLGLIPGTVTPIAPRIGGNLKVPQIGWNALTFPRGRSKHPLWAHTPEGTYVYFVHSYAAECGDYEIAACEYGASLTAAAANGNVCGTQFHPEKSGEAGLAILRSFCSL